MEYYFFFELLQVALGNRERLSRIPAAEEWEGIYEESVRQAVTGILLHGIDRLPAKQRPLQVLLLQWIGEGQMIEQQNLMMDKHCCQLLKMLEEQGLKGSILKGQGIARLYDVRGKKDDVKEGCPLSSKSEENHSGAYTNLAALRQSGDIDVYVDCGLKRAMEFAKSTEQKEAEWDYKHLHLNVWDDTEVEMHYRVEVLLNLWKNRRLQKWFKKHKDKIFGQDSNKSRIRELENISGANTVRTNDTNEFATPTVEFNVFYILLHIYRHFLYEGVGMRQIVDYYFVLKRLRDERLDFLDEPSSKAERKGSSMSKESLAAVHEFGMDKFAKGLMWVMKDALGMPAEWMLWEPDKKEGEYILKQVMTGGNFGHYDDRLRHCGGKVGAVKAILMHNLHLLAHYPSDVIWAPVWIIWHKLWKIKTRMTI